MGKLSKNKKAKKSPVTSVKSKEVVLENKLPVVQGSVSLAAPEPMIDKRGRLYTKNVRTTLSLQISDLKKTLSLLEDDVETSLFKTSVLSSTVDTLSKTEVNHSKRIDGVEAELPKLLKSLQNLQNENMELRSSIINSQVELLNHLDSYSKDRAALIGISIGAMVLAIIACTVTVI